MFQVNMNQNPVMDALEAVVASGHIAQGPRVDEFEDALSEWTGGFPVALNSGTSALTLALRLAGVTTGSEVITTPMTCSATNLPILSLGGRPVWADVVKETGNLDVLSIYRLIRPQTKAILAVDWGGQPAEWDWLARIAQENDIKLIVDAAHSLGATQRGKLASMWADYVCYSFQAIKHLTTGDGGALVCADPDDTQRARKLRWFGIDRDDPTVEFRGALDIDEWGYKFHMNDINASVGLANLKILDRVLTAHRNNAKVLDDLLDERFGRTFPLFEHVGSWWLYTVLLGDSDMRDKFRKFAISQQLQVSQVHWRNDRLSVFKGYERPLPGVDSFSERMICLPVHEAADPYVVAERANRFWT